MSETRICANCGAEYPIDEMFQVENDWLCESCADRLTVVCDHCNERIYEENAVEDDHYILCDHCFDEYYIRCEDCGRSFVGKRIHLKSGERVEYSCDTYHRYGKEYCSSHAVDERILDELITKELMQTKEMYEQNFHAMEQLIDQWQPKASAAIAQIKKQQERIAMLEEEMEAILMERIRDKANTERYDRMIQKREAEIAAAQKQIEELQNIEETLRGRQAKLKRDISMMDDILKEGRLSEAHLRLLVDKIYVHEEDGKLSLDICLKAPFRDHMDIYENGEQTECWVPHSYGFELLDDIIPNNLNENE